MAVRYENECCDCAVPLYPCRGASCPNRHVPHVFCDNCGDEIVDEDLFDDGNGILMCAVCLERKLLDVGVDIYDEDFNYEDYADVVSIEDYIEQERI